VRLGYGSFIGILGRGAFVPLRLIAIRIIYGLSVMKPIQRKIPSHQNGASGLVCPPLSCQALNCTVSSIPLSPDTYLTPEEIVTLLFYNDKLLNYVTPHFWLENYMEFTTDYDH
jgi:hypothetical protein